MSYLEIIGIIISIIIPTGLLTLPVVQYFTAASVAKKQSDDNRKLEQTRSDNDFKLKAALAKSEEDSKLALAQKEQQSKLELVQAENQLKIYLSNNEVRQSIISSQQKKYEMMVEHTKSLFEDYVSQTLDILSQDVGNKLDEIINPISMPLSQQKLETSVLLYAPSAIEPVKSFHASIKYENAGSAIYDAFYAVISKLSEVTGAHSTIELLPSSSTNKEN